MNLQERYEWRWKLVCWLEAFGRSFYRLGSFIVMLAWKLVPWTAKVKP